MPTKRAWSTTAPSLEAEARLFGKLGIFDKADVAYLVGFAKTASYKDVKSRRSKLVAGVYESTYLKATRYAREQTGFER